MGPPCWSRTKLKTSVLEPESHGGNPSQGSQEGGGLVRIAWGRIMPAVSWRTSSKWARLDGAARGEAPPHPGERSGSCGCRDVCRPRVCLGGDGLGVGGSAGGDRGSGDICRVTGQETRLQGMARGFEPVEYVVPSGFLEGGEERMAAGSRDWDWGSARAGSGCASPARRWTWMKGRRASSQQRGALCP